MYLENPDVPLSDIGQLMKGEFDVSRHMRSLGIRGGEYNSKARRRMPCVRKAAPARGLSHQALDARQMPPQRSNPGTFSTSPC